MGSVGMLLSVVIATVKLLVMESTAEPTEMVHRPDIFATPIVAFLDIVFTYGGQVVRFCIRIFINGLMLKACSLPCASASKRQAPLPDLPIEGEMEDAILPSLPSRSYTRII